MYLLYFCITDLAEVSGVAAILFSRHRIHFAFPKFKCCCRSRQKGFRGKQTPDCCLEQGINCHIGFAIFEKTFISEQSFDWWRKPLMKCWMSASPAFASAHKATGDLHQVLSALLLHRDQGFDSGAHRDLYLPNSRIHRFGCPGWAVAPCVRQSWSCFTGEISHSSEQLCWMPLKIRVDLTTLGADKMVHLSHSSVYHKSFILTGWFRFWSWTSRKTS